MTRPPPYAAPRGAPVSRLAGFVRPGVPIVVKVRAVSALAALVVFPLAILLLLAGAVAVLVRLASDGHSGLPVIKLLILPLVIAVYVGVKQIRADRPQAPGGPELTRSEHPLLWAEVERLAAVAQTEPPHRITLVPDVNAAVVEVGGRREMIVGLPLLATMSVGELRSVLAHELGHFAGGDTALSARTARAQLFLVAVAERSSGVVRPLLRGYAHLYARVSAASSRDMESAADGFSLRVAGSRTAADAMRQLVATSLAWSTLARDYVPLFDDARLRASLTEGLRQLVAANREGWRRPPTRCSPTSDPPGPTPTRRRPRASLPSSRPRSPHPRQHRAHRTRGGRQPTSSPRAGSTGPRAGSWSSHDRWPPGARSSPPGWPGRAGRTRSR